MAWGRLLQWGCCFDVKIKKEVKIIVDNNYLLDQAELLYNILEGKATGKWSTESEDEYKKCRRIFISNKNTIEFLPSFVKNNINLDGFWSYIKKQSDTYEGRRNFLRDEFSKLFLYLESDITSTTSFDESVLRTTADYNGYIRQEWDKAIERRATDPEGAITSARTLLETVCKHILDELNIDYKNDGDLPKLYRLTASALNLSPDQHTEEQFKQILGGATSVINGLSSIRNKLSDAHGHGTNHYKPSKRHAALCVNMAGTIAEFLIETLQNSKNKEEKRT